MTLGRTATKFSVSDRGQLLAFDWSMFFAHRKQRNYGLPSDALKP
jgi:hypothetical protein